MSAPAAPGPDPPGPDDAPALEVGPEPGCPDPDPAPDEELPATPEREDDDRACDASAADPPCPPASIGCAARAELMETVESGGRSG